GQRIPLDFSGSCSLARAHLSGLSPVRRTGGTRNYWVVLPLVFCENRNIGVLKQAFEEELGFAAPQVYRQQVAELVRLYRAGRTNEIDRGGTVASGVSS